jgi:translocation and assembly module TamA
MTRGDRRKGGASSRLLAQGGFVRGSRTLLALTLAASLAACGSLREAAEPDRTGTTASAPLGSTAAPLPVPAAASAPEADTENPAPSSGGETGAAYRLVVEAPGEVRGLLQQYLDLGRFQGEADADRITAGELNRLIAAAPAQARSLLETEGFFAATVTVDREAGDELGPPRVVVRVTPGPRAQVTRWSLNVEGELADRGGQGATDALELINRLRSRWPLRSGEDFRQPAWTSAKNSTLALLRAEGYPAASIDSTEAKVDAGTHQVEIKVVFDSGPRFVLGELRIEGLQRYDESAVRNVADFSAGTPYSEKRMLDFQERLTKIGLFESVTVEIDPDPAAARATPVIVKLREQTLQQATTGVGFSDNTGPRVTLEHRHRRPFGWDLQAHNKFEIGRDRRSWEGELITHPTAGQYRNLVAGSVSRLDTAGDVTIASRARVGRLLETERLERLVFAEVIKSVTTNPLGRRSSQAVSANQHWVWRGVDSVLLPTEGYTASLQTAGGYSRSNYAESGPFGRLYGRVTGYWPLGRSWYSSLRVEAGHIISQPGIGLPDALLFRAGGDDSVRGYAYRTLGPTIDGVLTSGRQLFTTSAEIARPISANRPSLWWAAFVDAGNAANKWSQLDPVVGYGVGLRWRSPVGPLKLDVAYGEEVRKTRLHLSVGIAF